MGNKKVLIENMAEVDLHLLGMNIKSKSVFMLRKPNTDNFIAFAALIEILGYEICPLTGCEGEDSSEIPFAFAYFQRLSQKAGFPVEY